MSAAPTSAFRTFRDPAGSLRIEGDRVLRTVRPDFAGAIMDFLASGLSRELMESGDMIPTAILGTGADGALELEHPRVSFPSYPWEWCVEQWIDAAVLTLDICARLLESGLILKDASPLNVLFNGSQPVLVDLLSVEARDLASPLWIAYGQFVRTFLLPLIAYKYLGWPLAAARNRRDGYEPEELFPYLSVSQRWFTPCRNFVTIPVLLDRLGTKGKAPRSLRMSSEVSGAVIGSRLRRLKATVLKLSPGQRNSTWSGYTTERAHYSAGTSSRKEGFVHSALERIRPATLLDIGANTGDFSRMAARNAAKVVALDTDGVCVSRNYVESRRHGLSILPLHADIARPTPPAGWRNVESLSLLDRCRQRFDCLLMLGLLHHLLVSDGIPLSEIAQLVSDLAPRWLLIEWIPPSDAKFIEICRGRDALYKDLTEDCLHEAFAPAFRITTREALDNGRVLLLLEAR